MRRFGKTLAFSAACTLALVLTIRHSGDGLRLDASSQLRAAIRNEGRSYDLADLPVVGKTLYYVRDNYFDKKRLDPRRMLVGALDWVQRDVPEVIIDRVPEKDPRQVTVRVGGQQKVFDISTVTSPWGLTARLKEIFAFIQPNLGPVPQKEEGKRLVEIEMAAANGILDTLDPHSSLMDVEQYKDMRTTTQAKFGGLGIVIGQDPKGRIVVRRPMKDTPAFRAGILAKDRIVRINSESTQNMTLNEAVDRMRGQPGEPVDIYVERDKAAGTRKFTIVRDYIHPPSIDPEPRVLPVPAGPGQAAAKIGYFHLVHFSASSDGEVKDALALFERERVKGIIIDVRGNPGGLYDQAQKVADAFVEQGTIVATVGPGGSLREEKVATPGQREPKLPVAVLTDPQSASASEILAGALKNLDRGVIIGQTTYGKGSVQVLYDVPSPVPFGERPGDDTLGLRLTIAQYLTPGDVSIQAVGVTPDVETVPLVVWKEGDRESIRLQASKNRRREVDYQMHLESAAARTGEKPAETVAYLIPNPKPGRKPANAADEDEEGAPVDEEQPIEDEPEFKTDFNIELARDLLAQARGWHRRDVMAGWKAQLERARADEDKKVSDALGKLGVDWSPGPATGPPATLEVSLAPATGAGRVNAGEVAKLRGTVRNLGTQPAFRVRAVIESDNGVFDESEMVFGKIGPGESRTYDIPLKIPQGTWTRTDLLKATVSAARGARATPAEMTLTIDGKPRPLFAYSYQTIDDQRGNRDGQVQRGEQVRTLVTVKNIGAGKAPHTELILRNGPAQPGILISAGRFDAKDLAPGASKSFSFIYEVTDEYRGDEYALELSVVDVALGDRVEDKIKMKIAPPATVEPAGGTVTVTRDGAVLREGPGEGALVVGKASKGSSYKVTGRIRGTTRIEVEPGRPAFVAAGDVTSGGGAGGKPGFALDWQVTPPVLTASAPTVVGGETVRVTGTAVDDKVVRDVFVRVWSRSSKMLPRKVFYQANRAQGDRRRIDFEADVPLWPGSNVIQVYARESNDIQSLQNIVVLRRAAASVLAQPAQPVGRPPIVR